MHLKCFKNEYSFSTMLSLCWYKAIYKKPDRKIRSESRHINENDTVQWLGNTFCIFRRLAAEWRRIAFVYDVIGKMAIATSIDARGDLSHRKRRLLKRWLMAICRRNLFHFDLRVCTELQVLFKNASRLWFNLTKSTRTVTLQDVPLPNVTSGLHMLRRQWQF